jgi:RNase H-like domain found in reverse transcriptase
LVIFFGEHVESAADRLAPLYEVLVGTGWNRRKRKKQKMFVADWAERWKEPQVRAVEALREILAHPDFLVAPRPLAQKNLMTDASMYGLGAVLLQWEGEAVGWLPVAFASRKQKGAEVRYTVTEKECLAVLFELQKFRQHLNGERFGVVTDHSALVWLMSLRDPKHRLARWILEFQSFDFEVEHAPGNGSIMVIPDALSRDTMDKDLMLRARCLETVGSVEEELTQADLLQCADLSVAGDGGAAEGDWGREGYGGRSRKVSGWRGLPVVPSLHRDGYPDCRTESFARCGAESCAREQSSGALGGVEDGGKIAEAILVGRLVCGSREASRGLPGMSPEKAEAVPMSGEDEVWHPKARFETIAVDILEISPTSATGMKKVVVIGDVFSRFMMAIAMPAETATAIAEVVGSVGQLIKIAMLRVKNALPF